MPENVVNGIFTLLVAALVGLFGYGSAIAAAVRKERNQAIIEFQSVFWATLLEIEPAMRLYSYKGIDLLRILEREFPKHVTAYLKFRQYLTEEKRIGFDAAWYGYCQHKTDDGNVVAFVGKYCRDNEGLKMLSENINKFLSFAELNHKSPFDSQGGS